MLYPLVGVAVIFLMLSAFSFYDGIYYEGLTSLLYSLVLLGVYFILKKEKKETANFIEWLSNNYSRVLKGEALYNGIKITPETELKQYQVVYSFTLFSVKLNTRYYIEGYQYSRYNNLIFSSITFFLGWWGLPYGPINTVKALFSNLRGGKKTTVSNLLEENKEIIEKTERDEGPIKETSSRRFG